ncbi:N-acetylglucosaminyl deacetylase, LmbE family [Mariniphaga anaerophila]|uniref:N-acetylglucosaminyl deacetylase, LmbE family n=1 Tax=Mariniphaga anaerophila TaxID=1484053 RepID=A0A1M5BKT8_9BACT|nr:PIG-L deacetylase family protein [Mariniphaga anaerophila]SHF43088.1 N-acetylglucosaminyl deacetylase, LmbE family [Mariniphaga anaerophila]
MKIQFNKEKPLNILCLGAHCDDIEIGAGGTILKLQREYKIGQVVWVVFSSNEIRRQEAKKSADLFLKETTNKEIAINSFRDGFFPFQGIEIKEYFEEIKQKFSPDIIFTHFRDDRHQDHRIVSDLTWNTWRSHFILEYEIPKYDGDLGKPNFYVSLDEEDLATRNRILIKTFKSQSSKHWFDENMFNALPRLRGIESATQFAEAFYARKLFI